MTHLSDVSTLLLEYGGIPRQGSSLHLELSKTQDVFFILSGTFDLFFERREAGESARRHPIFTLGQDHFLWGLGQRHPRIAVIASSSSAAAILQVPYAVFSRLILERQEAVWLRERLEAWFLSLLTFTKGYAWPSRHLRLGRNDSITLEQGVAVWPSEEMAWFRVFAGEASFLDLHRFTPISQGLSFPLAHHTWLETCSTTEFQVVDFATFLAGERVFESFDQVHMVFQEYLEILWQHEREQSEVHLASRESRDSNLFMHALRLLVSPLSGMPKARTLTSGHAIYDAATLVCQAMDLPVVQLPDAWYANELDMVLAFARSSHFRIRAIKFRNNWWCNRSGPLLGFLLEENEPVALTPSPRGGYHMVFPRSGKRVKVTEANHQLIRPRGYQFYKPLPKGETPTLTLLRHGMPLLLGEGPKVLVPALAASVIAMLFPLATSLVFNSVLPAAELNQLNLVCLGLILASLGAVSVEYARGIAVVRLESALDGRLQTAVWDRLLRLPTAFFKQFNTGDLAQRAMGLTTLRSILSQAVLGSTLSSLFTLFMLTQLFFFNRELAWVASALTCLSLVPLPLNLLILRQERKVQAVKGRLSGFVLQILKGISKLRVAGAERRVFGLWADQYSRGQRATYQARWLGNLIRTWNSGYSLFSLMILFAYASQLRSTNPSNLGVGTFLALSIAFGQLISGVLGITKHLLGSLSAVPLMERLAPILKAEPEVGESKIDPGNLQGAIEVRDLSFAYEAGGRKVLSQINISVMPGEFVAVVGPSGSGKSTLLRLLLGFEKPTQGSVFYDGKDLRELSLPALRRQLGVVLQDSRLMAGNIFEQITGSLPLTMEEAWEAATMAGLEKDIGEMPMGMFTILGEGGTGISGGQRQRILIARALVTRPKILMMDEATSALDNESQRMVSENLEAMHVSRIVIAHRLSTIINANKILVLDKGAIVEAGGFKDLIAANGLFRRLVERQLDLDRTNAADAEVSALL